MLRGIEFSQCRPSDSHLPWACFTFGFTSAVSWEALPPYLHALAPILLARPRSSTNRMPAAANLASVTENIHAFDSVSPFARLSAGSPGPQVTGDSSL
jgi:hypothetical protein